MRIIIAILGLMFASQSYAADPPNLAAYKTKVQTALPVNYGHIDVSLANSPTETLNKKACYYDGTKVLHELSELHNGDATWQPDIEEYMGKCNIIIAARYAYEIAQSGLSAPSGYTRFPHGLFNYYVQTGDATTLTGFDNTRDSTNWRTVNVVNERVEYSREVAYALQTYTRAAMLGRPHANQAALIAHFRDMALSHLNQWHTGTFYPAGIINTRQSFMVGLTMMALIEYYENIDHDSRIPAAIKYSIDDLWSQMWYPDVRNPMPADHLVSSCNYTTQTAGYGAFYYRSTWTGSAWVNETNNMPSSCDVNADTNMMVGAPMMWYGVYSSDTTYRDKAVDIWNGMVYNAQFNNRYDGGQWEGSRYNADFIRWYRKSTGSTCGSGTVDLCTNQSACISAGGNWTGIACQHAPVAVVLTWTLPSGGDPPPSTPTGNLSKCSGKFTLR